MARTNKSDNDNWQRVRTGWITIIAGVALDAVAMPGRHRGLGFIGLVLEVVGLVLIGQVLSLAGRRSDGKSDR